MSLSLCLSHHSFVLEFLLIQVRMTVLVILAKMGGNALTATALTSADATTVTQDMTATEVSVPNWPENM